MNKFVMILVALVVTLFGANALAFEPPPAPADGTYVVDQTGKLSDAQKRQLNQKIEKVNRATKNEFGILLLGNMGGDSIEDVAYNTYKKWGVGKRGLDNGCLIVVSIKERKSRIETGKGVGGDVPDITAKKILDENLAPHLKRGDFYGGFDATLDALSTQIESRHAQKAEPKPVAPTPTATPTATTNHRTNSGGCSVGTVVGTIGVGFGLIFLMGVIGVVAIARYISRKAEERRQEEIARAQRQLEKRRRFHAELERKQREAAVAAEAAREREIKEAREAVLRRQEAAWNVPTPPVPVPSIRPRVPRPTPRISSVPPPRVSAVPSTTPETPHAKTSVVDASVAAAAAAATAAALAAKLRKEQEERLESERLEAEERSRREREERRAARARAEQEQEEREAEARREREQQEREEREREEAAIAAAAAAASLAASAFSWGSSSSSDDNSSSSSYSSDDSSSGFGGGDSGGGGASSDWGSSDDSGSSWDSGNSDSGGGDSGGSSSDW
jgi:uncharacterized protein